MNYLLLVLSLPTENSTVRQRAWRALKTAGAAVLRDGVYIIPDLEDCATALQTIASDVTVAGGTAHVLRAEACDASDYRILFDRTQDYSALLLEYAQLREQLAPETVREASKQLRKLRKAFQTLVAIDFYPGESQRQAEQTIQDMELECDRLLSRGEPQATEGSVMRRDVADYQGRIWATRQRPWVDRLASAWLIQRFIDPKARFIWLVTPELCPPDVLGFDFDGATFSHVGSRVTFETLLASFELHDPALHRLAAVVHFLDVGGLPVPEAAGLEAILAGLRASIESDDQLLASAFPLFDSLYTVFQNPSSKG